MPSGLKAYWRKKFSKKSQSSPTTKVHTVKRSKKRTGKKSASKFFSRKKRSGAGSSGKINWMNHFTTALIAAAGLFGINYLGGWLAKQMKIDPKYNEVLKVALALSPLGLAIVLKKYKPQLAMVSAVALATVIYDEAKKRLPVTVTAQLAGVGYIPSYLGGENNYVPAFHNAIGTSSTAIFLPNSVN